MYVRLTHVCHTLLACDALRPAHVCGMHLLNILLRATVLRVFVGTARFGVDKATRRVQTKWGPRPIRKSWQPRFKARHAIAYPTTVHS
jgi:hypothetical protein